MLEVAVALAIWFSSVPVATGHDASFEKTVKPILEQRCQPCHFPGGKMYERLPFDRPATIVKLGTRLFTRIRDEREREAIRAFLANENARPAHRGDQRGRNDRLHR